jgi:asparagine synthase (glutamine-hydrolysing)
MDATSAERGDLLVVGQVRVDAREDLVRSLRQYDASVRESWSDIAIFAAAYEQFGTATPLKVLGDFAVLVWDSSTRGCTLVRDRFGVRMLYYAVSGDCIAVSNSLEAVLESPGVSRALHEDAIADYLVVGFNEDLERTTYRDVRRVPPAHMIELTAGARARRYWHPSDITPSVAGDPIDAFRSALTESVRDRLRSERASVLMSGGLDSTSLAAIGSRLLNTPASLRAVTVDLPAIAPSPDAEMACEVAGALGISHVILNGDESGFREGVAGEPPRRTVEPSDEHDLHLWHTLLRECASWSSVLLYGEDPDALLAPPGVVDLVRGRGLFGAISDVARFAAREGRHPHLGVRQLLSSRDVQNPPAWLREDLGRRRRARAQESERISHPRAAAIERLTSPQWQSLLESMDARVTGIPIDARFPFLDMRVVTAALSAPPIPWTQGKRLLREAVAGLLPDEVRLAPKLGLPALWPARVNQWRARAPQPFVASDALREFVDVRRLPELHTPAGASLELRLRALDRWLRGA